MTDTTESQACYALPTLTQRFWRAVGFRYHLGDEPEGTEMLPGWMRTDMHMRFGFLDRLRIFISGKLFIASILSTDTPCPKTIKSRMDWRILLRT